MKNLMTFTSDLLQYLANKFNAKDILLAIYNLYTSIMLLYYLYSNFLTVTNTFLNSIFRLFQCIGLHFFVYFFNTVKLESHKSK